MKQIHKCFSLRLPLYSSMHQKYFMHTFHFVTQNVKKCALKSQGIWEFPGGLVVRILGFHCSGSIPDQGAEILQAVWRGFKKKKKSQGIIKLIIFTALSWAVLSETPSLPPFFHYKCVAVYSVTTIIVWCLCPDLC